MDEFHDKKTYKKQFNLIVAMILITLTLIIGILTAIFLSYSGKVMTNLEVATFTPEEVAIEPEVTEQINRYNNKIKNVLLIGIDSTQNRNEPQRSDSMIIVSLDDFNKSIKMSSLMRDTLVDIDGYGKQKLNHAYAYGGAKLLLKTINQNFDMNLQDYALVDFNNLIEIIDAIGGVDLYITWEEAMYTNFNIKNINKLNDTDIEELEVKTQNIRANGAQALSFSRIRYLDSDYKRSERQRIVLLKIYERFREVPLLELPGVVMELSKYVKTTLDQGEILDIAGKALGSNLGIHGLHFPTYQTSRESTKGSWHLEWDREETIEELHNWIFKDIDPYRQMTLEEIRLEKESSNPSDTTAPSDEEDTAPDTENTSSEDDRSDDRSDDQQQDSDDDQNRDTEHTEDEEEDQNQD